MKAYLVVSIMIYVIGLTAPPGAPSPHGRALGKLLQVALIIWAGVLLAACTPAAPSRPAPTPATPITRYTLPPGWYDVAEFRLEDGTRCVSVGNGGVTCDWRRPMPPQTQVE